MLAEGITSVSQMVSLFTERVGLGLGLVLLTVAIVISLVLLIKQRPDHALLLMAFLSFFSAVSNQVVANGAFWGRWFFLALASVIAVIRPARVYGPIFALVSLWALLNLGSSFYSSSMELGLVRTAYFALVIPGCILALGPPLHTPASFVGFVRWIAIAGVLLGILHLASIAVAPSATAMSRFKSFYAAQQPMSIATSMAALTMIWVLLSKQAGRWKLPILLGLLLNLLAMVASTQRTGLFSLGAALAIMLCFYRARGVLMASLAGGAIALAWPLITVLVSENVLSTRLGQIDFNERSGFWAFAFYGGLTKPWIGHGSGSITFDALVRFGKNIHNAYLAVFYDMGLLGVVVFLLMLLTGFVCAWRLTRASNQDLKSVGVFLLATFSMITLQGVTETGLADTANPTSMLLYLGLAMAGGGMIMLGRERAGAAPWLVGAEREQNTYLVGRRRPYSQDLYPYAR